MLPQTTQLRIQEFRQQVYQTFTRRADALFEIIDALLMDTQARSPVELTLHPAFRRRWSSLYDALDAGRLQTADLITVLQRFAPTSGFVPGYRVLALDHSSYPRPEAPTVAERAFQHQPTKVPGAKPVTIGHAYSFVVEVPEADGSWVVPWHVARIGRRETAVAVAIAQVRQVVPRSQRPVLLLVDSEYVTPEFLDRTTRTSDDPRPAQPLARVLLGRLRPNRKLYRPTPPYPGRGRPVLDGPVFHLKQPPTWGTPDQDLSIADAELGAVRIRVWNDLHFKKARAHALTVLCVQVLKPNGRPRYREPLWLVWHGGPLPDDWAAAWRWYLRRFAVEHFLRFCKQSLLWTAAQLGDPERERRWTWVVCLAYWQLWLARAIIQDQPRPWERALPLHRRPLSPGRVRRVLGGLFVQISTPAAAPKRRGKSPGRQPGQCPGPRPRFRVVKKGRKRAAVRRRARRRR